MHTAPPPAEASHRKLRFISVIAATAIALSCGTNYAYSAWAPQFSEKLHLSATSQNLIGNFGNIGMYAMGIPGGMLIDSRGPRWGVLLGAVCLAAGYFPLRSAYVGGAGSMGVPALCFFALLTGMGSCTAFSAALKVCATNWPKHRGTATAFPLSAFGLSAFAYTIAAGVVFPDDTEGYLLLLACGTTVMVFVGMFFLQTVKSGLPYEAVATEERPGLMREDSNQMRRSSVHSRVSSKGSLTESGTPEETSSLVSSSVPSDIDEPRRHADLSHHKPDITGMALFHSTKFWQLFFMLFCLCGVGLMTINNIGNNARSLWHHYDDSATHDFIQKRQLMHVSILSVCSFVGRLSSGIGSDFLLHHHCSRFWTLVVSATIFTIAQVVALSIENPNQLFWLSGLTGIAYGMLFGVYPALVADAFGTSGQGVNWGAMTMAPVVSGNVYNLAYGRILDSHSSLQGGEMMCADGRACYESAYYLTLLSSIVGVGWALYCIRHEHVGKLSERRAISEAREHAG